MTSTPASRGVGVPTSVIHDFHVLDGRGILGDQIQLNTDHLTDKHTVTIRNKYGRVELVAPVVSLADGILLIRKSASMLADTDGFATTHGETTGTKLTTGESSDSIAAPTAVAAGAYDDILIIDADLIDGSVRLSQDPVVVPVSTVAGWVRSDTFAAAHSVKIFESGTVRLDLFAGADGDFRVRQSGTDTTGKTSDWSIERITVAEVEDRVREAIAAMAGVPPKGLRSQHLVKLSDEDWDTRWESLPQLLRDLTVWEASGALTRSLTLLRAELAYSVPIGGRVDLEVSPPSFDSSVLDHTLGVFHRETAQAERVELEIPVEEVEGWAASDTLDTDHAHLLIDESTANRLYIAKQADGNLALFGTGKVWSPVVVLEDVKIAPANQRANYALKRAYEANPDTNAFTDDGQAKLAGIEEGAQQNVGVEFTQTEKTKLGGVEENAKDDQSAAEIKTAYESNSNTNALTDAAKVKLDSYPAIPAHSSEAKKYVVQVPATSGAPSLVEDTGGGSTHKGVWNTTTTYQTGDSVVAGALYICISGPSTNQHPAATPTKWVQVWTAAFLWSSTAKFYTGHVVWVGTVRTRQYTCIVEESQGVNPTTAGQTHWMELASPIPESRLLPATKGNVDEILTETSALAGISVPGWRRPRATALPPVDGQFAVYRRHTSDLDDALDLPSGRVQFYRSASAGGAEATDRVQLTSWNHILGSAANKLGPLQTDQNRFILFHKTENRGKDLRPFYTGLGQNYWTYPLQLLLFADFDQWILFSGNLIGNSAAVSENHLNYRMERVLALDLSGADGNSWDAGIPYDLQFKWGFQADTDTVLAQKVEHTRFVLAGAALLDSYTPTLGDWDGSAFATGNANGTSEFPPAQDDSESTHLWIFHATSTRAAGRNGAWTTTAWTRRRATDPDGTTYSAQYSHTGTGSWYNEKSSVGNTGYIRWRLDSGEWLGPFWYGPLPAPPTIEVEYSATETGTYTSTVRTSGWFRWKLSTETTWAGPFRIAEEGTPGVTIPTLDVQYSATEDGTYTSTVRTEGFYQFRYNNGPWIGPAELGATPPPATFPNQLDWDTWASSNQVVQGGAHDFGSDRRIDGYHDIEITVSWSGHHESSVRISASLVDVDKHFHETGFPNDVRSVKLFLDQKTGLSFTLGGGTSFGTVGAGQIGIELYFYRSSTLDQNIITYQAEGVFFETLVKGTPPVAGAVPKLSIRAR